MRVMVALLNAMVAFGIQAAAPGEPALSDRLKYEYAGAHPFAPECPPPSAVYCYRFLVPAVLELLPIESGLRWRIHRWSMMTAAGTVLALTSASLARHPAAALLATIVAHGSYGFAFTAYDPYSADPAVYALIAVMAWCWLHDRWRLAFACGIAGLFAKETVALMSAAMAVAAVLAPRRLSWRAWVAQGAAVLAVLAAYRWWMQAYVWWKPGQSASLIQNDLASGGWLTLWLQGNTPATMVFLVFAAFGFAWLFAALGYRASPVEWRNLAAGGAVPFLALNYVQNPERALGNLFFIVVPLAAIVLARVPIAVAMTAALLNAAIIVRAATSSPWLPGTRYLLVPAALSAAAVVWLHMRQAALPLKDRRTG